VLALDLSHTKCVHGRRFTSHVFTSVIIAGKQAWEYVCCEECHRVWAINFSCVASFAGMRATALIGRTHMPCGSNQHPLILAPHQNLSPLICVTLHCTHKLCAPVRTCLKLYFPKATEKLYAKNSFAISLLQTDTMTLDPPVPLWKPTNPDNSQLAGFQVYIEKKYNRKFGTFPLLPLFYHLTKMSANIKTRITVYGNGVQLTSPNFGLKHFIIYRSKQKIHHSHPKMSLTRPRLCFHDHTGLAKPPSISRKIFCSPLPLSLIRTLQSP